MLAGIYAVATVALGSISFLQVNLRFSNVLIGIVPILGWPAVFGISLGVFMSNIFSPLGPIDLLSALFSLAGLISIQLLKGKSVLAGLITYSIILSIWVTFELGVVSRIPFFPTFYGVAAGISFVVVVLGYALYRALLASGLKKRILGALGEVQ
jgi:uncharacterized membrane protein